MNQEQTEKAIFNLLREMSRMSNRISALQMALEEILQERDGSEFNTSQFRRKLDDFQARCQEQSILRVGDTDPASSDKLKTFLEGGDPEPSPGASPA